MIDVHARVKEIDEMIDHLILSCQRWQVDVLRRLQEAHLAAWARECERL